MSKPNHTPVEMLARLVAFDTTSRHSNMELIEFVAGYLSEFGIEAELFPNAAGDKANLFATIGPADKGGVILSGHTDVVPVDGQDWDSDPFTLEAAGDKLYGRGTCDMKGFIATVLSLVPEMAGADLETPVHLAFSYDEEVGCTGVHSMIDGLAGRTPKPQCCIVGEPTSMKVVNRHKGIRTFRTDVHGKEAHSSATDMGVSAVVVAGRLIAHLARLEEELAAPGRRDEAFSPPYTTVNVGTIHGGTAINILAKHCAFDWEYRPLPGGDEEEIRRRFEAYARDELLPTLREIAPDVEIKTAPIATVPGLDAEADSPAEDLARGLSGENETRAVSFGTEAGLFHGIGIPTIVCGPGDIAQAHQPNEFVDIAQLDSCETFLKKLIGRLSA